MFHVEHEHALTTKRGGYGDENRLDQNPRHLCLPRPVLNVPRGTLRGEDEGRKINKETKKRRYEFDPVFCGKHVSYLAKAERIQRHSILWFMHRNPALP